MVDHFRGSGLEVERQFVFTGLQRVLLDLVEDIGCRRSVLSIGQTAFVVQPHAYALEHQAALVALVGLRIVVLIGDNR